jgi:hypothetical protein
MSLASQAAQPAAQPASLSGLTLRALLLTVLLIIATYVGITRTGFIQINWVPYVTPPVPALLFLLILQGLSVMWARCPLSARAPAWLRPLSRGELLLMYAGLSVSLAMERSGYVMHYLLTAKYFHTEVNLWGEFFNHYPDYWIPKDERVILGWFEGSATGRIPWGAWWPFIAWWGGFCLLLVVAMMSISAFFRRQWTESERLTYPLLFLPIEITGGLQGASYASGFFRNPLMWVGFGLAAAFNGLNIAHAFNPSLPQIQFSIPLDEGLTDPPWRYLRPLRLFMGLEMWGLAYLVSGEVLFSTWSLHFLMKFIKMFGLMGGLRTSGFPFYQEVSSGGCLSLTIFLLWVARHHLKRVWVAVVQGPGPEDREEAMPFRYLALAFVGAVVGLMYMLSVAGLPLQVQLPYFGALFMFVIVAARIRAEVGPPVLWTHPYGFDQTMPVHFLGSRNIIHMAGQKGLVLFYALFWIGRTVFAHSTAQYFTDGLRLADVGQVKRRSINALMVVSCVVGLALAFWFHLNVGYRYGQGLIGAKIGRAGTGWGMAWSKGNYNLLRTAIDKPQGPDVTRMIAYGLGFLATTGITLARTSLTNFPLHPAGFILATLYGDHTPYWWPFFFAWACQRLALRYGGLPLYRKLVPAFLGLTLGHVLIGGVLWRIIINYFIDPVISARYYINIGG